MFFRGGCLLLDAVLQPSLLKAMVSVPEPVFGDILIRSNRCFARGEQCHCCLAAACCTCTHCHCLWQKKGAIAWVHHHHHVTNQATCHLFCGSATTPPALNGIRDATDAAQPVTEGVQTGPPAPVPLSNKAVFPSEQSPLPEPMICGSASTCHLHHAWHPGRGAPSLGLK
jgi:hypothetical protein